MDAVAGIARAVLYEGYLLWPYRRSAIKNRQRWTFGAVFPERYSRAVGENDPWRMRAECLLEGAADAVLEVRPRFLHVVERWVARLGPDGPEPIDELVIAGERHLSWEEATEREVAVPAVPLADLLESPLRLPVEIPAGEQREPLLHADGTVAGEILRRWRALRGTLELAAERLAPRLHRLRVTLGNSTPSDAGTREEALGSAFVSTHFVLRVAGGEFVSLTDPPAAVRAEAEACRQLGSWPVLVGEEGERHTLLAAPIILPDYPRIAPESPGDLFDGTEIDQLLVLNILALTEEEQEEMRASDPRSREILERCASLTPEQLARLHGAIREFRPLPVE